MYIYIHILLDCTICFVTRHARISAALKLTQAQCSLCTLSSFPPRKHIYSFVFDEFPAFAKKHGQEAVYDYI